MKRKWLLLLISGLVIGLLSGCNQIEELLDKANQILDQQIENGEEELDNGSGKDAEGSTGNIETNDSNQSNEDKADTDAGTDNPSDGHENEAGDDQWLTLEDRIQQGDYSVIEPPNGYPLPPPLDWHLIQLIKDPEDGWEAWEGVFCFNTQLEDTIKDYEQRLRDDNFDVISEPIDSSDVPDHKHVTKFKYNDPTTPVEGDMVYYIDDWGTACTKVYFVFE